MPRFAACLLLAALCGCAATKVPTPSPAMQHPQTPLQVGNFSVSLAVKDLAASRAFYEKLGFWVVGGNAAQNWLVLKNGETKIGLFQGMFEKNMLTFNPGWDSNAQALPQFQDVRDIQRVLKERGLTPAPAADEASTGTAFFMLVDPDGNPVLFDQHVPRPAK